ncbi:hypothetical protein Pst134EA_003448 [Puccinia striiformis f. sp. tritici]|uniref:Uncharacterized protein n=1 Tax=Puccinia striiformis f. sp. tritici PST-78 TaxID=1165861 RepID=A0A0L0VDH6_9BASI|nr:hypothetical protein Pst134EA_003448 [Puccinia striiformis f. sp. tritici]KAH9465036.1 hypothetical protein Pst134EB_004525 [Puccinia striiformis f. sp. tritici]KAH9472848.1 hypothetical protein Pst134EA_003448 [Puccinia striiformis f. sp. tritici]KAI9611658.1 hypothetical protein H4Q26_008613 [Puccinia striiformis f. sp. tritici PST-130]KNE97367.1 hypothetical protein PSTG_09344 [Puccinia striiformis f. sp. tritici PST-78]
MSDSEVSSSLAIDSLLRTLVNLEQKYSQERLELPGEVKAVLTQDDLDAKDRLFGELEFTLLPSIQVQLDSFVTSLHLDYSSKEEDCTPDFELAREILENIDETADRIIEQAEAAALDIIPIDTHDHHLERFKNFRCEQMMSLISGLYRNDLWNLCSLAAPYITAWQNSSRDPKNKESQSELSARKFDLLWITAKCSETIRTTIERFQGSDFDYIQDVWESGARTWNSTLRVITSLTAPPTSSTHLILSPMSPPIHTGAPRKNAIALCTLAIPLVKLARMFAHKLSQSTPGKLRFTLDTEMNSKTLTELYKNAESIDRSMILLHCVLADCYRHDYIAHVQGGMQHRIDQFSCSFESTRLILMEHLVPLPDKTDLSPPGSDYKAWFSVWQDGWNRAADNFLTLFTSLEAQQHQQPATIEP